MRITVAKILLSGVVATLMMTATPDLAQAQSNDMRQMMGRINQLEKQVQTMSRALYRGEKQPITQLDAGGMSANAVGGGAVADLEVRLSNLEGQLRQMTGRLEEQDHNIAQMQDQLRRALTDMDMRLNGVGGGAGVVGGGRSAVTSPSTSSTETPDLTGMKTTVIGADDYMSDNPTVKPLGVMRHQDLKDTAIATADTATQALSQTPEKMYDTAFALIREAEYAKAQEHFDAFLKAYPQHQLAANAQYWLSETYYVRGDYNFAAKQFAKGYQTYPKSAKAADNLLKLGVSLGRLDKKKDACLTFKQLDKEFPNATGSVTRRAEQEKKRLGCE